MEKSKIEWTDSTWNPVTGCKHDCPYCYARVTANRFKGCNQAPEGKTDAELIVLTQRLSVTNNDGVTRNAAYPFGFVPTLHEYRLNDPLTKGFGKTVFVCSMADLFGEWVPDEWIDKVFEVCMKSYNHRFLFLTKNPERYIRLADKGKLPSGDKFWYGTSTTSPNMPKFYSTEHHTFVSIEPILEPFGEVTTIPEDEWVIFGAETGKRTNKVVPKREWIEKLVEQLRACGTPIFMKDSMKPVWGENLITEFPWNN